MQLPSVFQDCYCFHEEAVNEKEANLAIKGTFTDCYRLSNGSMHHQLFKLRFAY